MEERVPQTPPKELTTLADIGSVLIPWRGHDMAVSQKVRGLVEQGGWIRRMFESGIALKIGRASCRERV